MDTTIVVNPLRGILDIAAIISRWKIFDDRNEKGWYSLIPFYSDLVFGRTCKEEQLSKKLVIGKVFMYLVLFILMGVAAFMYMSAGIKGVSQLQNSQEAATILMQSNVNPIPLIVAMFLFLILLVYVIYLNTKLGYKFTQYNVKDAKSWWILVWLLVPQVAQVYFAFFHKKEQF